MTLDEIVRQQAQPAIQRGPVVPVEHIAQPRDHQLGSQLQVVDGQRMVQGFIDQTLFPKPGRGRAVELGHLCRTDLGQQSALEQFLEQVVIAVPLTVGVQCDHE